jgi:hypothetical protein
MGNNSGARLYEVLIELRSKNNTDIKNALMSTLNYEKSLSSNAYYAYADLLTLVRQTRHDLSYVPDNDLYLETINKIENALILSGMSMETPINQFINKYDSFLTELRFCAHAISQYKGDDASISDEELSKLIEDVNSFENKVLSTAISNELTEFIIDRISEIRSAIILYKIKGPEGLKKAIESSVGAVYVNRELILHEENSKGIVKHFFEILGQINLLVTMGKMGYPLLEPALHHVISAIS